MEIPAPVLADGAWANDQLAAVDHVPLDVLIQESTGWLSARPGSRIRSEPKKRPKRFINQERRRVLDIMVTAVTLGLRHRLDQSFRLT
jgi:hypothetical protein